jgi:glucokinase
MSDLFLGIDLGGTSIKIGLCDLEGRAAGTVSIPTSPERGPEDTLDRAAAAAAELQKRHGKAKACGSGVPGPLDLERSVILKAPNLKTWNDVPYPALLQPRLGIPTFMENDANCAAWGEYIAGIGKGYGSLALYTLGTGVGGGIILHRDLWVGASGAAGELGHMCIDPQGPPCGCGQRGCVEQYASASAVARKWGRGSAKECFDAARRGDPDAVAVLEWSADGLAEGVAALIHVLHPEIVVLAGGLALAGDLLLSRVRDGVRRRVFKVFLERIRIETSRVPGDDAGWIGAALWGARKIGARPS